MKRLIFLILLTVPFCLQAQWSDPPTMEQTPDTVANLGARKDLRQLVNWNAMRNQLDREDIDTLEYTVGDSATVTWQFIAADTATCTTGLMYRDSDDDSLWYCLDGAWFNMLSGVGGGGGSGDVTVTGTPSDNQVAIWTSSSSIEGDNDITFDGTNLLVGGSVTAGTYIVIGSATISETELEIIDGATLTTTELNYTDGVTSAIQDQFDDITTDLNDSITMRRDVLAWAFTDSAQMAGNSKKIGIRYYPGPDSIDVDSSMCVSLSASPNFTYNIHWAADISGADTDMFSSAVQVNGADATSTGEVDTPNNNAIPPKVWIWVTFVDRTAVPLNGCGITVIGTYY